MIKSYEKKISSAVCFLLISAHIELIIVEDNQRITEKSVSSFVAKNKFRTVPQRVFLERRVRHNERNHPSDIIVI